MQGFAARPCSPGSWPPWCCPLLSCLACPLSRSRRSATVSLSTASRAPRSCAVPSGGNGNSRFIIFTKTPQRHLGIMQQTLPYRSSFSHSHGVSHSLSLRACCNYIDAFVVRMRDGVTSEPDRLITTHRTTHRENHKTNDVSLSSAVCQLFSSPHSVLYPSVLPLTHCSLFQLNRKEERGVDVFLNVRIGDGIIPAGRTWRGKIR